jgi:bifunctional DNA-binding transcriptional regulator/antitoxin component of YhaV-PrlF toxin-antitoxin module
VTIPPEVREALGVEPHDRVAFVVEGTEVHLRRVEGVLNSTASSLKQ